MSVSKDENVFFSIDDNDISPLVDLSAILTAVENTNIIKNDEDVFVSQTLNYEVNFNVKVKVNVYIPAV